MGTEGVQEAMGKPPGRARRREIPCVCKHAMLNLQTNEAKTFVNDLKGFAFAQAKAGPFFVQASRAVYAVRSAFEGGPPAVVCRRAYAHVPPLLFVRTSNRQARGRMAARQTGRPCQ